MHNLPHLRFFQLALSLILVAGGASLGAEKQASGLKAVHRAGQTFLTWQEVDSDRLGLVTLENVRVSKARHRIQIGER